MILGVDLLYFIAAATTCKAQMRIVQWVDKLVKRLNCALQNRRNSNMKYIRISLKRISMGSLLIQCSADGVSYCRLSSLERLQFVEKTLAIFLPPSRYISPMVRHLLPHLLSYGSFGQIYVNVIGLPNTYCRLQPLTSPRSPCSGKSRNL